ncbi:MAG: DUF3106 domain-containing protein [Verrucomicrobiales bacterium]|nr:DUF3106 domain-containing protein [Verrucomicrobiales bacterium]
MKPGLVLAIAAVLLSGAEVSGQEPVRPAGGVRVPIPPPPVPPARKAPTDLFRELLAASPAGREAMLTNRTTAARRLIESKLQEFEVLPPDQRELRLRVAELQFYLSPLLRSAPEGRARLLGAAPVEVRPLLEERLRAWEALPADRRKDLLDSESMLSRFVRLQVADPAALTQALQAVPDERRAEVEAQFLRWRELTPGERSRRTAEFQRFFELRPGEQQKVLKMISAVERGQMEQTLQQFHQLPADQRDRAVRGFRQFMEMSASQREEFLQNAAKWQAMTPAERDAWRRVVERVTHPLPLPIPPERARNRGMAMTNSPGR